MRVESRELSNIGGIKLTLSQSRLATSRLAEYACACTAKDDGLRVREDGGDGKAAWEAGGKKGSAMKK